jgi:uncharacterized protein YkwD
MRKKKNLWALETALVISLTACSSSSPTNVVTTDTPTMVVSTLENDTSEVDETTTKPTSETTTVTETTKKTTTGSEETKATTTAEEKKTTTADTEEDTTTTAEKETTKAEAVKETEQDPAPESPSGASTPETTVAEAKETAKAEMQTAVTTTKKETATAAPTKAPATTAQTTVAPTTVAPTTAAKVVPVSITATVSGTHYIGDSLTGADFTVTVKMSDGSSLTNPAGFTATPLTLSGVTNSITVAYSAEGKTVSTTITVKAGEKPKETTQVVTTTAAPTTTTPAVTTPTAPAATETQPEETQSWTDYLKQECGACTFDYEFARQIFDEQNKARVENGVPALVWSDEVYERACYSAIAVATAYTQGKFDPFTGSGHDYSTPYRECIATDYTGTYTTWLGENLSYFDSDAKSCVQGLLGSSGHRDKMLNKCYTKGAVAVFKSFDSEECMGTARIISLLYDDDYTVSYTNATCTYPY